MHCSFLLFFDQHEVASGSCGYKYITGTFRNVHIHVLY